MPQTFTPYVLLAGRLGTCTLRLPLAMWLLLLKGRVGVC